MSISWGLTQNRTENNLTPKAKLTNYLMNFIQTEQEEISEEDKQIMETRILQKLEAGKKLSSEEVDYLKKYNPMLYQRYLRIQMMAETLKEQLKHAKSKEQANEIICQSIGGIPDKDPDKKYIVAAMNEAAREFQHSPAYNRLPSTNKDAEKRKSHTVHSFGENKASDEQDALLSWSPLQEIIDMQPTFVSKA